MEQIQAASSESQLIGSMFLDALCARDYPRLGMSFHADVRSRLLIPRGLLTPPDRAALIKAFQQWFDDADCFELEQADITQIGARLAISYRMRLHENDVWYTVEQQTYSYVQHGRIEQFDLMCSGFQPDHLESR